MGGLGAAVGAAASVSGARPAQAAQNDYAVLGQSNSGGLFRTTFQSTSAYTTLEVTNPVLKAHALVANARDVAAIQGTAIATGGIGVEGICQAEQGIAQGTGVRGEAYQGVGVLGTSSVGVGVRGESTAGIGVSATAQTEAGARCSSGSGPGMSGVSTSGPGATALSLTGPALVLSNPGLDARPTDPKGATWQAGSIIMTTKGELWLCVATGAPGTWRLLMAPGMSGAYVPITPTRVFDSRFIAPGPARLPEPIPSGGSRLISVATGYKIGTNVPVPLTGVPAGVHAIAINLTVTNTSSKGWLSLQPGDVGTVGTSSINWTAGQTIANGLMVTLDDNRQLNAFANSSAADVIIDVAGYFRST